MELRHLRYFVAVAEERHFGRAAQKLHMAQPPLSSQIRSLEAELGFALFERTTRSVELTSAGAEYLTHVQRILAAVDDAGHMGLRIAEGRVGRLVVGCVGSATYDLMPAYARALHAQLPNIEVSFRGEMLVEQQVQALRRRELDLAILRPPGDDAEIIVTRLRGDRLAVALPTSHPLARRRRLAIANLEGEPMIVHSSRGSVMFDVLFGLCAEAGFRPLVRHEVVETSTLVTFVAAGLGIAVVPERVAQLGVPGVTYSALSDRRAEVDLSVAVRRDESRTLIDRALAVLAAVVAGKPGSTPTH